jgi:hypothetical protein
VDGTGANRFHCVPVSFDGPIGGDGKGCTDRPFDSFSYRPPESPASHPAPAEPEPQPSEPPKPATRVWTHGAHMSKRRLTLLRLENEYSFSWDDHTPPMSRGDCLPGGVNEQRPCPWARCRWHLAFDYNQRNGSLTENFPDLDFDQIPQTCALDVADRGETSLDDVGQLLNVTREAMRLTEIRAFKKIIETSDPRLVIEWLDLLRD